MTLRYGSTRTVLLIRNWAIKVPVTAYGWRHFVMGMLANDAEADLAKLKWPQLCPVILSLPLGLLIVMRRARPLTREEFYRLRLECASEPNRVKLRDPRDTDCYVAVEDKSDSFGYLDDQLVAVDYGN